MSAPYVENDKPIWLKSLMTEITIVVNYFPNNHICFVQIHPRFVVGTV